MNTDRNVARGDRASRRRDARKRVVEERSPEPLPPFLLASVPPLGIAALALLPRVHSDSWLLGSVLGAAAILIVLELALRGIDTPPRYEVHGQTVHWVQATMQGCVYVYW